MLGVGGGAIANDVDVFGHRCGIVVSAVRVLGYPHATLSEFLGSSSRRNAK